MGYVCSGEIRGVSIFAGLARALEQQLAALNQPQGAEVDLEGHAEDHPFNAGRGQARLQGLQSFMQKKATNLMLKSLKLATNLMLKSLKLHQCQSKKGWHKNHRSDGEEPPCCPSTVTFQSASPAAERRCRTLSCTFQVAHTAKAQRMSSKATTITWKAF